MQPICIRFFFTGIFIAVYVKSLTAGIVFLNLDDLSEQKPVAVDKWGIINCLQEYEGGMLEGVDGRKDGRIGGWEDG